MVNFSTSVLRLNNLSGTSFTINVTPLQLSPNLNETDFLVLHDGVNKTSLYTKTNTNAISYTGPNVQLGTIVQVQRLTPLLPSDTTFLSLSTAAALTNGLSRLRLRTEELYSLLFFVLQQLEANGVNLAPTTVIDEPYGPSWNSDTLSAPSRNSVYARFNQLLTGSNTFTGSYNFSGSSSLLVPSTPNNDNSTKAASTAFAESKKQEILNGSNTFTGNNTFAGATTLSGTTTLAGSSSFTGASSFSNTASFSSSITVPTISNARNSSTNAASTAFVQNAIYSNVWCFATRAGGAYQFFDNQEIILPLDSAPINRNNCYNTSTFTFTCPETGWWWIYAYAFPIHVGGPAPLNVECELVFPGLNLELARNRFSTGFCNTNGGRMLQLNQGQQVQIRIKVSGGAAGQTIYRMGDQAHLIEQAIFTRIS
jgi:hypothetical protein